MVNSYLPKWLLEISTSTTCPRQNLMQKDGLPGVNRNIGINAKKNSPRAHLILRSPNNNHFIMLFFCAIVFFTLFPISIKSAFSEEKNSAITESLRFKIIGDQEAPAVRYFVPWKSPEQDEMLAIPTPDLQPLNILDPHELRREIDYYSTLHTLRIGSKKENTDNQLPVVDATEADLTEHEPAKTMSTNTKTH